MLFSVHKDNWLPSSFMYSLSIIFIILFLFISNGDMGMQITEKRSLEFLVFPKPI